MKRIFLYFLAVTAVLAVSCSREVTPDPDADLVFGDVAVSIGEGPLAGEEETRSVITVNAENFKDAYLFAFDASSKAVLTYPEHAGDLEGSGPVAVKVNSKTFNWALPVNKAMDIWVVVNAGSYSSVLDGFLTKSNLKESDLYGSALMFSCRNSNELKALETSGYGIPMSGMMNNVKLTSFSDGLSVTVKRLFAKYNIYFDTSGFTKEGYTVKSTYLMSSKSNTEVPFFYDGGYAQTDISKLATVDRSTESDLVRLDNGGQATLYYLENCQGDKSGAKNWYSVYDDLGSNAVKLCSYMEVGVNVTRSSDGTDKSFAYRIYLGKTDMKSNFDVERNYFRTIKLTLKPGGTNHIVDGFMFTNEETLAVAPGGSVTIPFETSLSREEIDYSISGTGLTVYDKTYSTSNTLKKTSLPYSGTVTLKAAQSIASGRYEVTGGNTSMHLTDVAHVNVEEPLVLSYSVVKQTEYIGEYMQVKLPEVTSSYYINAALYRVNGSNSTSVRNIRCGGSNSQAGNVGSSGLWWDYSGKVLYVLAGYAEEGFIRLTDSENNTVDVPFTQKKVCIRPDSSTGSGLSYSYGSDNHGKVSVELNELGQDVFYNLVPCDALTGTVLSASRFNVPAFVGQSHAMYAYYELECAEDDLRGANSQNVFGYSLEDEDTGDSAIGSVTLWGLYANSANDPGLYVELSHGFFDSLDLMVDVSAVNGGDICAFIGTYHNTQVATGSDLGCTVSIPNLPAVNPSDVRRVRSISDYYSYGSLSGQSVSEAMWTEMVSAESCMTFNSGSLRIASIGANGDRYPCGTYVVRKTATNPHNNRVFNMGYLSFNLILDIKVIPTLVLTLEDETWSNSGTYNFGAEVSSYRFGLTPFCPLSNKHNSYASYYFPEVSAYFVANASGRGTVRGKDGAFEKDYSGPASVSTTLPNYVAWNARTTSNDHYWTSLWKTSSEIRSLLEIETSAAAYLSTGLNWRFSAPYESNAYLDIVPGCAAALGSMAIDGGFYHIEKVTDSYIQHELDDYGIY